MRNLEDALGSGLVTILRGDVALVERSVVSGAGSAWSRLTMAGHHVFCGPDLVLGAEADGVQYKEACRQLLDLSAQRDVVLGAISQDGRLHVAWMLREGRVWFAPMNPLSRLKISCVCWAIAVAAGGLGWGLAGPLESIRESVGNWFTMVSLLITVLFICIGMSAFVIGIISLLPWPGPKRWAAYFTFRRALSQAEKARSSCAG